MNTPFETKLDSMILQAEIELDRAKKDVISRIEQLQFDLERTADWIKQDQWRGINELGIVQAQGSRLDVAIAEVQTLRKRLDDLKTMRDVALAAIKSAKEK
jgi:division protein CdvB (Snf7/Vps24/ESCRT-III family)